MKDIHFYCSRLSRSSLREIRYRVGDTCRVFGLRTLPSLFGPKVRGIDVAERRRVSLVLPEWRSNISDDTVDWVLGGGVFTYEASKERIRAFENEVRHSFFADITLERDLDIRFAWEVARLQHLILLLAVLRKGEADDRGGVINQFVRHESLGWIEKNQFPYGPHFMSVMECGLRIPVFLAVLKLIPLSRQQRNVIYRTIFEHAWLIQRRLSQFSSLGNHTVCEGVGLIFAGMLFGIYGEDWLEKGLEVLKSTLDQQVLDDGGPAEQSLSYQRFVLDQYWLAIDFVEKNSVYDFSGIKPRLQRGEAFLRAFQDAAGDFPSIGDSDDGHALGPGLVPKRPSVARREDLVTTFPDSGYTVIRGKDKLLVTFDHGPLGMPPLYNHGHADALSITLSKEGRQILVDPGTYRYNGVPEWRKYFKGTRCHNTVTLDGLDQAVQETSFIWSSPYTARLVAGSSDSDGHFWVGVHDGYARLKEPVKHQRTVVLFGETDLVVKDSFVGSGVHEFELNWHLHPDVTLKKEEKQWVISTAETRISMRLLEPSDDFKIVEGSRQPILGWYSPSYGFKEPCPVLQFKRSGEPASVQFKTVISFA